MYNQLEKEKRKVRAKRHYYERGGKEKCSENYKMNNEQRKEQRNKEYWGNINISRKKARIYTDNRRFGGKRKQVFMKCDNKCSTCGISNEKHIELYNRELCVHHIDGKGKSYPKNLKNNNLDNLILLCMTCHMKVENKMRVEKAVIKARYEALEEVEKMIDEKIKHTKNINDDDMIDIHTYKYHLEELKAQIKKEMKE